MPPTDLLITFFLSTALFAFVPGPAMLYAAARTLAGGRRAGLMAAFGVHVGGYAHVLAAAMGLSALFHAVPVLYTVVKLAGAAYLVFQGWRLVAGRDAATEASAGAGEPRRAFVQSIVVELLNPKTAIFFLAFLPQFVRADAGAPLWLQFLVLGAITNLMFSIADIVAVVGAGGILSGLRASPSLGRWSRRAAGSLLIGLGARLACERS
ncbi:LysE family translocator [Pleomorphomonas koreensis]|uniref:LysE family translocator n=1 Tax=Pleomorphomonas koreensis TaxID=257440 RepID=UPI0004215E67|nr:LysE family translocator [Pleomorphomonas koreensis]